MSMQIWQHRDSGERYHVEVRGDGTVRDATGPLASSTVREIQAGESVDIVDYMPELIAWINEHTDDYRVVWPYQSA